MTLFIYFLATEILKLCDDLRDNVLPERGVRLEDHEGNSFILLKISLILMQYHAWNISTITLYYNVSGKLVINLKFLSVA